MAEQVIKPQTTKADRAWRLPTALELISLVNFDQPILAEWLRSQGFTNVKSGIYWSSTSYAKDTSYAWIVDMNDDFIDTFYKFCSYYVWPMRSVKQEPMDCVKCNILIRNSGVRFVDTGNETIIDTHTDLEWMKDAGAVDEMTYHSALDYVAGLNKK